MKKMNRVAVVGTVFMDIKGFAENNYDPVGTNIGEVKFFHGGVGRNAAMNLANIGIPVSFLSTIDNSGSGDEIISGLSDAGIDTSHILRTKNKGIGMWLAVLNSKGELCGSISHQPDLTQFEQYIEKEISEVMNECDCVVLEIDMTRAIAEIVLNAAKKSSKPVYAIVGNMSVINANKHMLSDTSCFICNNIEAGKLIDTDLSVVSIKDLLTLIKQIADKLNINSMIITNGADGAVYYDRKSELIGHQPAFKTTVIDTTGAGDAFFSGAVGALILGFSIEKACEYGTKLASQVIASPYNSVGTFLEFFN